MRLTDSIYALNPTVVTIRGEIAYDKDENIVEYDKAAVIAHAASKEYITKRASEYPTIGDQLDALWKGGDAATQMLALVQAVKNKYPKGTE
jgi:hypothetical protein